MKSIDIYRYTKGQWTRQTSEIKNPAEHHRSFHAHVTEGYPLHSSSSCRNSRLPVCHKIYIPFELPTPSRFRQTFTNCVHTYLTENLPTIQNCSFKHSLRPSLIYSEADLYSLADYTAPIIRARDSQRLCTPPTHRPKAMAARGRMSLIALWVCEFSGMNMMPAKHQMALV